MTMFSAFYKLVCAFVALWLQHEGVNKSVFYVDRADLADDDGPNATIPPEQIVRVTVEFVAEEERFDSNKEPIVHLADSPVDALLRNMRWRRRTISHNGPSKT